MMGWHDGGPGWGGWVVMTLVMMAFWALVVFGAIALYRTMRRDDSGPARRDEDAQRLLDERLARGEIDSDDYRQRRELLRSGRG